MPSAEVLDGAVGCIKRSRQRAQRLSRAGADKADTLRAVPRVDKAYAIEDDEDMSVAQEDVLVGTVCSLHDYCRYLTGSGDLEDGETADVADEGAHLSPSHKNQLTTDSPGSGGRSAHVPERASDRVSGTAGVSHCIPADAAAAASSAPSFPPPKINAAAPANVFCFAPPMSRGAETTGRGMCSTNLSKRWQVLGDDDGGKAAASELDEQQQVRRKHGTATAGIRPRRLCEDVGHHHWSCIASNAFLEEKVRICRRSHEPSRMAAAVSCAHPPAPPQRLHVAAPVPRRQERAAHNRRERTAPTTDAGVLPLSSTSCAALSPAASDVLEVGCSAAALSASHSVGVLLAHQHEWIYFSVLFHAHAVQLPRTSAESAAARLASNRSLDLSHLYCFLDPPCRLYTEELEEWARAARERRRERERVRDDRHIRHGPLLSSSAHDAPARTHPTASRLDRGTEASDRVTLVASAPLSPCAAPMASPRTWLVYVHPDVSLQTLPRLWSRAFREDASNSGGGGAGQEAFEGGTTRVLDGHHEVDGRDGRAEHEGVVPSYFYAAAARKRRRQAAEVEMLCRHLLSTTPPRRHASSALLVHPAEVSVSARARSRGRPIAAASTKADTGMTSSTPSTAALLMSDAAPQRLPTSATGLPHEVDRHREQQRQALACALLVSPLPRGTDLLKRRRWLVKPFVLVEELKYGRVVKYSHAELAAPRVL
ncbi:conserved hypothetical protein [Leishmania major strain Friedlin]|uniref:Uncharacterized protein n=1 Tax=Leishmania major TaxID=5664 RepID=E9ACC3_LEIMA|nr:conserved hypothetical protein [Leishmania major strain Friedlin]CAG9567202.1 hypothetical_protein_-_conserved [Leishmania major strain Friedlin]CBZ11939.1 conserved hypothetical protein [Leishmania major strain Friedlin]|eukprot:XP_003721654.1 conserved hypothetical protein [Leishmania major strain Friedlin]